MSQWIDPDGRLWTDQPRHAWSPDGRLLTWCLTIGDDGARRHMYRLGRRSIPDDEGEKLRELWGGRPD
jgi:hypothetical protein